MQTLKLTLASILLLLVGCAAKRPIVQVSTDPPPTAASIPQTAAVAPTESQTARPAIIGKRIPRPPFEDDHKMIPHDCSMLRSTIMDRQIALLRKPKPPLIFLGTLERKLAQTVPHTTCSTADFDEYWTIKIIFDPGSWQRKRSITDGKLALEFFPNMRDPGCKPLSFYYKKISGETQLATQWEEGTVQCDRKFMVMFFSDPEITLKFEPAEKTSGPDIVLDEKISVTPKSAQD